MPHVDKQAPTGTQVAHHVERALAKRLPPGWSLHVRPEVSAGRYKVDLLAELVSPAVETAVLAIKVKRTLEPRGVLQVVAQLSAITDRMLPAGVPVVAASYLSPRTRVLLRDHDIGYIDTTGNVHIEAPMPGLFISSDGVDHDPWPRDHKLQSLRGRGAARAVRAIVDRFPPYGVRELAQSTSVSAPTLSRVLELLERDAIVDRIRGAVSAVDWQGVVRRWTQDYDQTDSNTCTMALEPRGLPALEKKLLVTKLAYVATGAFAAQRFDPIAPARIAAIYVTDAIEFIDHLDLRRSEAGANVMILEPLDPVVFDRALCRDGLRCVAPSHLAADLLTGPGREPSQGEHIIEWMARNQHVWRS